MLTVVRKLDIVSFEYISQVKYLEYKRFFNIHTYSVHILPLILKDLQNPALTRLL